jgi:hypothetical protein
MAPLLYIQAHNTLAIIMVDCSLVTVMEASYTAIKDSLIRHSKMLMSQPSVDRNRPWAHGRRIFLALSLNPSIDVLKGAYCQGDELKYWLQPQKRGRSIFGPIASL